MTGQAFDHQDIWGQRVRIRTEDKSVKLWGRVIDFMVTTEPVDVTRGPDSVKLVERPDVARVMEPRRISVRMVIEVEL